MVENVISNYWIPFFEASYTGQKEDRKNEETVNLY